MHPMEKQDILAKLREHEAALKAPGVSHAALFGSRARGDAGPDSDIDILVDIAPDVRRDSHPELPWRSSRDGNFYRHQYDNVAASYVWETVTVHLPPLLAAAVAEIKALEGET